MLRVHVHENSTLIGELEIVNTTRDDAERIADYRIRAIIEPVSNVAPGTLLASVELPSGGRLTD